MTPDQPDRLLPVVDTDPEQWAEDDHPHATATEIAEGNRLGDTIDVDNDDDAGDP